MGRSEPAQKAEASKVSFAFVRMVQETRAGKLHPAKLFEEHIIQMPQGGSSEEIRAVLSRLYPPADVAEILYQHDPVINLCDIRAVAQSALALAVKAKAESATDVFNNLRKYAQEQTSQEHARERLLHELPTADLVACMANIGGHHRARTSGRFRCADMGAGVGLFAQYMAGRDFQVDAVDSGEEGIALSKLVVQGLRYQKRTFEQWLGDAQSDLADPQVDFLIWSYWPRPEMEASFNDLLELLSAKPNSVILIISSVNWHACLPDTFYDGLAQKGFFYVNLFYRGLSIAEHRNGKWDLPGEKPRFTLMRLIGRHESPLGQQLSLVKDVGQRQSLVIDFYHLRADFFQQPPAPGYQNVVLLDGLAASQQMPSINVGYWVLFMQKIFARFKEPWQPTHVDEVNAVWMDLVCLSREADGRKHQEEPHPVPVLQALLTRVFSILAAFAKQQHLVLQEGSFLDCMQQMEVGLTKSIVSSSTGQGKQAVKVEKDHFTSLPQKAAVYLSVLMHCYQGQMCPDLVKIKCYLVLSEILCAKAEGRLSSAKQDVYPKSNQGTILLTYTADVPVESVASDVALLRGRFFHSECVRQTCLKGTTTPVVEINQVSESHLKPDQVGHMLFFPSQCSEATEATVVVSPDSM